MKQVDPCVAGVDGCRAGWLVVVRHHDGETRPSARIVTTFADVLALPEQPSRIAIDIPVGLPQRSGIGGRAADIAARARLGARRASVFAVPARAAVMETDYAQACAVALVHSDPPRQISKQTFNLFAKMREVDAQMTPALQARVVECHPELAFWAMNGGVALGLPKKVKSRPNLPGLALRRQLLAAAGWPPDFLEAMPFRSADAGPDDLLDACACAWTALRVLRGEALCFPASPPRDARGLRQVIWA